MIIVYMFDHHGKSMATVYHVKEAQCLLVEVYNTGTNRFVTRISIRMVCCVRNVKSFDVKSFTHSGLRKKLDKILVAS